MKRAFLGGLMVWAVLSGAVQAHAFLLEASPKVGSADKSAPAEIRLTMSDATRPDKSTIDLFDSTGNPVPLGRVGAVGGDKSKLAASVRTTLTPGTYVVKWKAVCDGGHQTFGDFKFRVTQ